jgi:hypothetical protein
LGRYENDLDAYKGYLAKIRDNLSGKFGPEVDSIVNNVFR